MATGWAGRGGSGGDISCFHFQTFVKGKCIIGGSCYKYHFCRDKIMSQRQAYFCRNKRRVSSRQARVCCDKSKFVATKLCLFRQIFVATKVLSRQKTCFVATKMILEAAPANDKKWGGRRVLIQNLVTDTCEDKRRDYVRQGKGGGWQIKMSFHFVPYFVSGRWGKKMV